MKVKESAVIPMTWDPNSPSPGLGVKDIRGRATACHVAHHLPALSIIKKKETKKKRND